MSIPFMQEPLLFFSCGYPDLKFHRSRECGFGNLHLIDTLLDQHLARVALLQTMTAKLQSQQHIIVDATGRTITWQKTRRHIKLEKRGREGSLESKFAKFGKILLDASSVKYQGIKIEESG